MSFPDHERQALLVPSFIIRYPAAINTHTANVMNAKIAPRVRIKDTIELLRPIFTPHPFCGYKFTSGVKRDPTVIITATGLGFNCVTKSIVKTCRNYGKPT